MDILDTSNISSKFESLKELDSWVFFEILALEISEGRNYQNWWFETETNWMVNFNGNRSHYPQDSWNEESGINGTFKGEYYSSKLYRYDGTKEVPLPLPTGWKKTKGVLIRDHYNNFSVVKVHAISDNLQEFLSQKKVKYERINRIKEKNLV